MDAIKENCAAKHTQYQKQFACWLWCQYGRMAYRILTTTIGHFWRDAHHGGPIKRKQWHIYMTNFWPLAIENTYPQSKCDLRKPKLQESNYKDTLS